MAHHKTYVGDTSETSSQTPSSTPTFDYCPNYGAQAPTRTGRGNQVTSSSDAHNCVHYYASPHYVKNQVLLRSRNLSRPDSCWALLRACLNFARSHFLYGRPAAQNQLAETLAKWQRSHSQWPNALRRANSRPASSRAPDHPVH